jgi:hypothetical protein
MPPKRNRPLTTHEAERMERARHRKELAPSIRESPHIEAQSLLSLTEKGKLQSGEGAFGYWDEFFFFFIIFLFVFFFFFFFFFFFVTSWPGLNRIDRILISTRYTFFSGSSSEKNVKRAQPGAI